MRYLTYVDTITRALAKELGPRKIWVNAIKPGGVETEGVHSMGGIGSAFEKQMVARTRSVAWGRRTTSRRWRCFSRPRPRAG